VNFLSVSFFFTSTIDVSDRNNNAPARIKVIVGIGSFDLAKIGQMQEVSWPIARFISNDIEIYL